MWISLAQVLIIMLCLLLCPILICVLLIFLLNHILVSLHHAPLIHGVNCLHSSCNLSSHLHTSLFSIKSAASSIYWRSISPEDVDRYCQSVNVAFLSFHQNCFRAQKFLAMCTTMLSNSASLQCCILFLFFKEDGQLDSGATLTIIAPSLLLLILVRCSNGVYMSCINKELFSQHVIFNLALSGAFLLTYVLHGLLKCVVSKYINNGSDVFACFLHALLKVGSKFNAACVKTAHTAMSYCCTENVKSSCVGYISIKYHRLRRMSRTKLAQVISSLIRVFLNKIILITS